jgi:CheY-like chemotaxis protein
MGASRGEYLAPPMLTRARILLADDHDAMQKRVKSLLEPEYEVVGTVDNGQALVVAARELDLIFL